MTNDVQSHNTTSVTTLSDTQVGIEREFDAPRDLVWELYTDPEALAYWLGPHGTKMKIEQDLRPGGKYRWTEESGDGQYVFFGESREVDAAEGARVHLRLRGADGPMGGDPSIDRVEFHELEGGRTKIVVTSELHSKEARDGMLESGMETGVREGYEKLDELLARRQQESR